ncbi:MAG: formate dehydrogenase subunit gamma [Rubrivivax sp.]|nr:formate dehydrogenase subunit gamma [Rubrivivax sp.]
MKSRAMPAGAYETAAPLSARAQQVRALAAAHAAEPGGLLPALHAVQGALGHIDDADVPVLAELFNRSRAEVHGVVTYYHHFRRQPPGRHVVQLCRAEACQACGADELAALAQERLRCAEGQTRSDGGVTLEAVYCLGLCASSPALALDGRLHGRVTPARLQQLLDGVEAAS